MAKSTNGKRKTRDDSSLSPKTESVLRVEPQRPSKARRSNTIESIPESEEDPGRTESQQLLATMKTAAKALTKPSRNDKFLRDFRKKVEADQQELMVLLQDKENSTAKSDRAFRDTLRSHLSAALHPPSNDPQASVYGRSRSKMPVNGLGDQLNPYYTAGMRLVEQSRDLMKEFDTLSRFVETTTPRDQDGPDAGWQADRDKVTRLLELGRKVAGKSVAKVVEAQETKEFNGEDAMLVEGEEYGEASVYFRRKRKEDVTLRDTLRRAESGVRRMVKGLPVKED